jgi:organic radical activating enzyme
VSESSPKSKFMSAADEMKAKLGPALCLAKWKQTSLHLTTGMTNSCYHPPLHKIDPSKLKGNPAALHNTDAKREARQQMLKGECPSECSYCWNIEKTGNLSDRHYRSGEPWAAEHYDDIVGQVVPDADVVPNYVEVNFSSVCNLACSYCSPQFSSAWARHSEQFGAYPTSTRHNDPAYFTGDRRPIPHRDENPYVDAFWEWWPTLYGTLKHFRMTGGEPTLDKNTYQVFDYILSFPKADLHVDVTSNFSSDPDVMDRYLGKVKELCAGERIEHFMQYVSLDSGIPQQAEYIREGLNYRRLQSNVLRYLIDIPYRNSLTFIITMNNLSLPGLKTLLGDILALRKTYSMTYQRIWFDTPLLRSPSWQSLQILPPLYQIYLEEAIEFMKENQLEEGSGDFGGFKDYEIQRMERNLAWMRQSSSIPQDHLVKERADFYRFFKAYQERHHMVPECLPVMFPQMKEFWEECKYHANNNRIDQ